MATNYYNQGRGPLMATSAKARHLATVKAKSKAVDALRERYEFAMVDRDAAIALSLDAGATYADVVAVSTVSMRRVGQIIRAQRLVRSNT